MLVGYGTATVNQVLDRAVLVRLPKSTILELRLRAAQADRPMAHIVRELIQQYLIEQSQAAARAEEGNNDPVDA